MVLRTSQAPVRFVEGLSFATHLLVVVGSTETTVEMALLQTDAPGVTVTPTPGFAIPPLSEVHLENVAGQLISLPQDSSAEPGRACPPWQRGASLWSGQPFVRSGRGACEGAQAIR